MQITRRTLSAQVRDVLLERIRSGEVPWGESINEVRLSTELGVSRTPLREALISLASAGYLENRDGQGFFFLPHNASELTEVAPVIATLEALALRLTPQTELPRIGRELLRMAKAFAEDTAVHGTVMSKDDEWHQLMISMCPNQFLRGDIEGMRVTFHRYESLLVPTTTSIKRVAAEHQSIAKHLVERDLDAAAVALNENWSNGVRRLLASAK